ncbi:chromosome segregation protein SMC, partial [Streptomyces sp. PU-14G]|uniref:chromosome segregation protein SMC n=1 Tax=Streptomyces sp. PU-14G TaxID=2800808 RepID=UPI0034DFD806
MHLKSLTLRGFKSFASATTLRFEPGITCVVGPNGSGKSNVVDALSWVMGEQGAKSLRGGKMEDVIFAGTTGRPPLGRAEVSLTIDNADGALPIEYAEVTITRIMFRNGGSEYQINGDTCRLLDIQELLSDSGIGREMHVIVGQGQLDGVLHADPTGRRAFIEEAAGVLKHRKRKEKALRKLDAMQANLARVQDLTDELRRQLKPLGRQAAAARKAQVIQAELRDARLRLLADDLVSLREALRTEVADEAELKQRKQAAEAQLKEALRREADLEQQVRTLTPRLERAQQTWYALSQLAERVRGTIGLADQRVQHAAAPQPEERRGRDPEEMEREAARVREQEAELEAALEAATTALDETVTHRAELERRLADEERRLRDEARALADRREGLERLRGKTSTARSRVASAQAEIDRLATSRDEALRRAEAAQEEYEALRGEVAGLDQGDEELAERHERAKRELAEAEASFNAAREALTEAERERAAVSARHDTLALNLRRKDGTAALLAAKDRLAGLLGPAAELLTVTPGHELPIAAALGSAADAVAVTDVRTAAEALRLLRKEDGGRASLIVANEEWGRADAAPPVPGNGTAPSSGNGTAPSRATAASALVAAPQQLRPAVEHLLAHTVVVDTLETAEEVVRAHPELTAVTAEGDILAAHRAGGGSEGAPSLLEAQAAVDEAASRLTELETHCERLKEEQAEAKEARRTRAAALDDLAARRSSAEREKSRVAGRVGTLAGQARAAQGEAERAGAAVAKGEEALARAEQEAEELAARLAVAEEAHEAEASDDPDTSVRDRLAADGANARQTEMEARLQVRTHEERVKALAGRADSLDRGARAEREARARAQERRERLRHEAEVAEAVADGARQLLAHVEASLERAREEREGVERAKAEREQALGEERSQGRGLKDELDKLTDSVHKGEVLGAEKRMRIEQLEKKALEELGVEPEGLVRDYGPDQLVPPASPAGDSETAGDSEAAGDSETGGGSEAAGDSEPSGDSETGGDSEAGGGAGSAGK